VRVVVDESVPTAVAEFLSWAVHDVTHIALENKGARDDQVW
jgi:predicted nuclease of predicted toxin-antitoxin system